MTDPMPLTDEEIEAIEWSAAATADGTPARLIKRLIVHVKADRATIAARDAEIAKLKAAYRQLDRVVRGWEGNNDD